MLEDTCTEEDPLEWTKSELTLKCGIKELAKAVIKQWHKDGRPQRDAESIKWWGKILEQEEK